MRTILVTGVSGHLGRQVLSRLIERYDVHGVSRQPLDAGGQFVKYHQVDLFDVSQVDQLLAAIRPEYLLHLAWQEQGPGYLASGVHHAWAEASYALYRAFCRYGGRRAALAGSVYEKSLPDSAYAVAKTGLRDRILTDAKLGGASAVWCRVFGMYGPGDRAHKFIPSAIASLISGVDFHLQNPGELWDYVHVSDVCSALVASVESDFQGIVDIASGYSMRLVDLLAVIREIYGMPSDRHDRIKSRPLFVTVPQIGRELVEYVGWKQVLDIYTGLKLTIDSHKNPCV